MDQVFDWLFGPEYRWWTVVGIIVAVLLLILLVAVLMHRKRHPRPKKLKCVGCGKRRTRERASFDTDKCKQGEPCCDRCHPAHERDAAQDSVPKLYCRQCKIPAIIVWLFGQVPVNRCPRCKIYMLHEGQPEALYKVGWQDHADGTSDATLKGELLS